MCRSPWLNFFLKIHQSKSFGDGLQVFLRAMLVWIIVTRIYIFIRGTQHTVMIYLSYFTVQIHKMIKIVIFINAFMLTLFSVGPQLALRAEWQQLHPSESRQFHSVTAITDRQLLSFLRRGPLMGIQELFLTLPLRCQSDGVLLFC